MILIAIASKIPMCVGRLVTVLCLCVVCNTLRFAQCTFLQRFLETSDQWQCSYGGIALNVHIFCERILEILCKFMGFFYLLFVFTGKIDRKHRKFALCFFFLHGCFFLLCLFCFVTCGFSWVLERDLYRFVLCFFFFEECSIPLVWLGYFGK